MDIASLIYSALNISFTLPLQIQSNIAVAIIRITVGRNNSGKPMIVESSTKIKGGISIILYLVLYLKPTNIINKPKNPRARIPL